MYNESKGYTLYLDMINFMYNALKLCNIFVKAFKYNEIDWIIEKYNLK